MSRPYPLTLVIDDNPGDLMLISLAFEEGALPTVVETEIDSSKALSRLALAAADPEQRPDAVLVDLNMPKVHGRDIIRYIRQEPRLAQVFVLVLTTSNATRDRDEAMALGANDYLVKPATFSEFKLALAEVRHRLETRAG